MSNRGDGSTRGKLAAGGEPGVALQTSLHAAVYTDGSSRSTNQRRQMHGVPWL